MPKKIPAKVGTQPWVIVMKGATKLAEGKRVTFRKSDSPHAWRTGIVTKVNEDGYPFIELM